MKKLLFCVLLVGLVSGAWLPPAPATAQVTTAGEAPTMLADLEDERAVAHLKLLKKKTITLKTRPESAADTSATVPPGTVLLLSGDLRIRLRVADMAGARSASPKVQEKYGHALKFLQKQLKAGTRTIALNEFATRDLEHLLAAWALPLGRVLAITWRGQPIGSYTLETYGGGPNQRLYPEGQIFYYHQPDDRTAGFYVYMNVPRPK